MGERNADAGDIFDGLLVLRSRAGDDAAFGRLVERYHGRLLYFVRRLIGAGGAQAEDVVQDAWLAAYRQLPRLRSDEAFRTWLYRIARNRALSFVRDRPPSAARVDAADFAQGPDETFTAEDAAAIHAGLARLPLEHREALTLRFIENMTYEQIAEVLACDLGTVKSRLHYAKKMLRKEMETM